MKTIVYSGGVSERAILTGMIVNSTVLARIAPKWNGHLFTSKQANLIAKWCIDYHNKYGKPPRRTIETIYEEWAENNDDKDTVKLIERILTTINEEYKRTSRELNAEHLIDLAAEHFNKVAVNQLIKKLEEGDITKSLTRIQNFNRIEVGAGSVVDLLAITAEDLQDTFTKSNQPLIKYNMALGNFFGDELCREGFICFMAPDKVGKSFWLQDIAWRAMLQRRKVAFFAIGDMTMAQMKIRFAVRTAKWPLKSKVGWPLTIKWPLQLTSKIKVDFEEFTFQRPLSAVKAFRVLEKKAERYGEDALKLSVHPNSSIGMREIVSILNIWERQGWLADVVVIDYADLLSAPAGYTESRDQINYNWKQMSALRQSKHCLVVTATQSNAAAYKKQSLDKSNFSEDKRKLAHVTGMVVINQTPAEKKIGLQRLAWIVLRDDEFSQEDQVYVASCLPLANPAVTSAFFD